MAIENWKNKIFKGSSFNNGMYDDSFPIDKLRQMGLPFTMACFEIAFNEVIAIGMDNDSQTPNSFIRENQNTMFTLDNAKPARKINTMFGVKIVHYAKHANTNAPEVVEEQDKLELDFLFHSSDHLRYENGRHIAGPHGGAPRAVKVESNITGNEGYTVTMFNTSGGQSVIQMAPKQMKLVGSANEKIQLKGYGIDTMGGSFEDYGLTIIHNAGKIEKCVLHMYDRSVDIEYLNSEEQSSISKNQEENVNILEYFNLFKGFPMNVRIDLASRTDEVTNTGCQYYAKGDLKNAIIYFEKALKIFPLNDDALNNLAVCYSELNNYEKMNEAKNKLDQIRKLGL